ASLGALVLFTVNGKINHDLSIKEFSVNHGGSSGTVLESGPVSFVVRAHNSGNVHEQPIGQVSVTDMFDRKVGAVNINSPPRNILPSSTRKFEQALDKSVIGNKKLFGRYKADLKLTYGNPEQTVTASTVFWVIPYRLIAALAIALVALFFILRSALRRYNRRIIEKARGSDQGSSTGSGAAVGDRDGEDVVETPEEPAEEEPTEEESTPEPAEAEETSAPEEPAEEESEKPETKKKKSSKRKK
ncbi:MAG TPA: hypothetical protein VFX84_02415, partial [Candidatus Saccharimonadales bacterium]|nr:hypothetical protein [Candidatus Saccharimonadales bacterium]